MSRYPPRRKPYRLVYQSDTSGAIQNSRDVDDYLHGVVDFMDDTHVDALFWHDGAGGNTAFYDSDVLELTGQRIGKVGPLVRQMIDEGNDPPAIVVREAKMKGVDVFYSFRINDCHDSIGDGESHPQLLATFKKEHPEWLIGAGHPYGGIFQLNFAVPEVLDLKFAVIEEVARKYDFDGIEIDFLRSAPHFIPGTEPENAPIITAFLQRVRSHLNERGQERDRPFTLAVRVSETMEACRLDGFDVAAWVKENLVDMIVLGSGAIDIEVEAFSELTRGTDILVYPCLYGWPGGYGRITTEMCRGLATNYWFQGADGIYTFNWNAHSYVQRPEEESHTVFAHQLELLREIDDSARMRGKDKTFAADRSSESSWAYPHNSMHGVIPAKLSAGERLTVPILIGEDLAAPPHPLRIGLSVEMVTLAEGDAVQLSINEQVLAEQQREGTTIVCPIALDQVIAGRNQVEIEVSGGDVEPTKLWIHVFY